MSSGNRVPLHTAQIIANQFYDLLSDLPGHMTIAGSIRRKKPSIGDIEIVCLPENRIELLNRLDMLEQDGTIKKALYGDKSRWGDRLRGCIFQRMQVEVTIADKDNFGYQLWLRTGPGDKNKFVMTQMIIHKPPVRFGDGYAWHVKYDEDVAGGFRQLAKLHIPDEWKLYHILGMREILPWERTEQAYRRQIGRSIRHLPQDEIKAMYAESNVPVQLSLFD